MKIKTKKISYVKATELINPGVPMFNRATNRQFGTYKVEAVIACEAGQYRKDDQHDFVNVNAGDVVGVKVYNHNEFGYRDHTYNTQLVNDLYNKLSN